VPNHVGDFCLYFRQDFFNINKIAILFLCDICRWENDDGMDFESFAARVGKFFLEETIDSSSSSYGVSHSSSCEVTHSYNYATARSSSCEAVWSCCEASRSSSSGEASSSSCEVARSPELSTPGGQVLRLSGISACSGHQQEGANTGGPLRRVQQNGLTKVTHARSIDTCVSSGPKNIQLRKTFLFLLHNKAIVVFTFLGTLISLKAFFIPLFVIY
jgi:hypothetical protein